MAETTGLKTSDYYYDLPERLIAQDPLRDRSSSRLMVLHKETGEVEHRSFTDIIDYLEAGDCLVLNDTRVIPARLIGTRVPKGSDGTHVSGGGRFHEGGSAAEILLLKRLSEDTWETIVHPGKKLREGDMVVFGEEMKGGRNQHPRGIGPAFGDQCPWGAGSFPLTATIKEVLPDGNRIVQFTFKGIWEEVLNTLGEMPLPPYITHKLQDKDRYQTVYARYEGSAAAPTAGLHFTKELLQKIEDKGIRLAYVTLHVGLGTFRPVKVDDVTKHHMHSEWYQVTQETADIINRTHAEGHRVICVGTTSCRTVETVASLGFKEEPAPQGHSGPQKRDQNAPGVPVPFGDQNAPGVPVPFGDQNAPGVLVPLAHSTPLHAATGDTSIFIYPGFEFRVMDGLVTNFHLPESTLLMLVSAFAGREHILAAYEEAVSEEYRFFSFGDAMLIV